MFCIAAESDVSARDIAAHKLYVMGTPEHGSKVIDVECPALVFELSSLQDQVGSLDEKSKRIMAFNSARFGSPMTKSGIFELDGQVNVYPDEKLVQLVDVSHFREIEMAERQKIVDKFLGKLSR